MHALVVYESMYGNTEAVARAIGEGVAATMRVDVIEVGTAPATTPDDVDLLVVGGPTHAFGLSRPTSRRDAANGSEAPIISAGAGVREWLDRLPPSTAAVRAAAFGTKTDSPRLPGSAAGGAHRRLRRLGYRLLADAENFYVGGATGPLLDGELARARDWGVRLGTLTAARVGGA